MAALHVVRVGHGPAVVLVHGSATDHTTWSIQLSSPPLRERFELVAVDRYPRPSSAAAPPDGLDRYPRPSSAAAPPDGLGARFGAGTVEAHAADLAELGRALYVGSSFGAVTVLELARTRPELVAGMMLLEPPMPATDDPAVATAQRVFFDEFERRVAAEGGPAAGEFFLRTVLGDAAYDRIPQAFLERSKARWAEIRADSAALVAYRPRYPELAAVTTPALLVGGERSASYFRPTLDALAASLPHARLEIVPRAGHMLHAEAPQKFAKLLVEFAEQIGIG